MVNRLVDFVFRHSAQQTGVLDGLTVRQDGQQDRAESKTGQTADSDTGVTADSRQG